MALEKYLLSVYDWSAFLLKAKKEKADAVYRYNMLHPTIYWFDCL